jgi:hypothetical protein
MRFASRYVPSLFLDARAGLIMKATDTKNKGQIPVFMPLYVNVAEPHLETITRVLLQNAKEHKNYFGGGSKEMVIVLENGAVDFAEIFKHTNRPSIITNPLMGHKQSVVRKFRNEAQSGYIVIVPDWQGLEIYASDGIMRELLVLAEHNCQDAYWSLENCDFENKCPFVPIQNEAIVWSETIDAILSAGIYLGGSANNFVLTKAQINKAICEFERLQIPVLNGMTYIQKPNGVFYRTIDNGWYCKQETGETDVEFLRRSIKTSLEYIENYPENDIYFGVVLRVV